MNDSLIDVLTKDHITLIVVLAVGLSWFAGKVKSVVKEAREFVAHVVDERVPEAVRSTIKATLGNGLRDMVTDVVSRAIDRHAVEERAYLDAAFERERARR